MKFQNAGPYIVLAISAFLLLTVFQNCSKGFPHGQYQASVITGSSNSANGDSPGQPDINKLEINLGGETSVAADATTLYIQGNCNNGNYPDNRIEWTLAKDTTTIATFSNNHKVSCYNGSFLVQLINFDKYGLKQNDNLEFKTEITAIKNGQVYRSENTHLAKKSMRVTITDPVDD